MATTNSNQRTHVDSGVRVRPLRSDDFRNGFLESLAALTEVDLTLEAAASILADLPGHMHMFVAESNGKVVGAATLLIERKFIHGGGRVGHIEDVAVHRDNQRQGIGTALIQHAIAVARSEGCYKVILDCFDSLVPFYERMGFRPFNRGLRLDLAHG